jgi:hypothetical protein
LSGSFSSGALYGLLARSRAILPDDGSIERRRLGMGGGQKPGRDAGYQRQRGSSEEIPAIHETTSRLLTTTLGNAVHAVAVPHVGTELPVFPDA